MVCASHIVGFVRVEQLRHRPCALAWQTDQALLLPTQGFQNSATG
jgi:hypothetical protein